MPLFCFYTPAVHPLIYYLLRTIYAQLFINFKLKSVAHLPWKAMSYKAVNTFIDDLFAFVVKMPTLHRIACLRDDLVFAVFLYQKWIYPVDKTRVNEFGQCFEEGAARDEGNLEGKEGEAIGAGNEGATLGGQLLSGAPGSEGGPADATPNVAEKEEYDEALRTALRNALRVARRDAAAELPGGEAVQQGGGGGEPLTKSGDGADGSGDDEVPALLQRHSSLPGDGSESPIVQSPKLRRRTKKTKDR